MRKYLVVALAALTTIAFATVAFAQSTPPTMKVSLSPKKAGTKKKPKSSKLTLSVANNEKQRTMSKLTITVPRTLKVSGKGFKTCSQDTLDNQGKAACPKGSKVGGGEAKAILGVNNPNPAARKDLTFVVTAFVGGAKKINFYLEAKELSAIKVTAPGTLSGNKLTVSVPDSAQSPAPGVFAGLVSLQTTLSGKAGKHLLIGSVGCKKHKQKFGATLTFVDNGVSPAGTTSASATSKCS